MRLPVIVTLVVCLTAMIGIMAVAARTRKPTFVATTDTHTAVPTFHLHDAQGTTVTAETLRGRIAMLYFGYTFCPDVCPTELAWMSRVLRALGPQAENVQPILISLDPERDTPEHLKSYAAMFDSRILALTGSLGETNAAAAAYGVIFQKSTPVSNQPGFYLIDHSMSTLVLGRDGHIACRLQSRDLTPDQAAAQIRALLETP